MHLASVIKEQTPRHPILSALQKIIASIIIDRDEIPFIFLCAPSGSGKTQLAFSLDTKIMYPQLYDSCFLTHSYASLITEDTPNTQLIYKQFFDFSEILKQCLMRDQVALKMQDQKAVQKTINIHYRLWTAAWILWCLKNYKKDWPQFGACGGVKLILSQSVPSSEVAMFKNSLQPHEVPCFFLDEINSVSQEDIKFIRIVFQLCRLPLILAGTDSSVANFVTHVQTSLPSHGRSDNYVWCHLVYRMPPLTEASVQALVSFKNEVMQGFPAQFSQFIECLCHGHPLFTRWALNFLHTQLASAQTQEFNPVRVLDQLFQSILQSVITSKCNIRDSEGCKAQIKLIVEPALPDKNQNLISHHFASIKIAAKPEEIPIAIVERVRQTQLQIGNLPLSDLHCSFPEIKDDPLLFLSLPGCLQSPSIFPLNKETVCPTARQAIKSFSQSQLNISNPAAMSFSGDLLEYLTQLSLFASSRFFGISGAPIDQFFGLFASHMLPRMPKMPEKFQSSTQFECVTPMKLSTSLGRYCKSLDNAMVGFCAPCNCKWPEFISSSPWIRTGYLCRARNAEMIDSRLESPNLIITTEEKNYADPLDLSVIKGILERVPSDSNLHIVVCQHIQDCYFTRRAFSEWIKESTKASVIKSSGICCVCLQAEDDSIFLGNISGLPRLKEHGTAARLVIFFEVGDISRVTLTPKPKEKGKLTISAIASNETEPEQSPTEPYRKRLKRGK